MDANLGDRAYRVLAHLRGPAIAYVRNACRNATADVWEFSEDLAPVLGSLDAALAAGERVFVLSGCWPVGGKTVTMNEAHGHSFPFAARRTRSA